MILLLFAIPLIQQSTFYLLSIANEEKEISDPEYKVNTCFYQNKYRSCAKSCSVRNTTRYHKRDQ